MFQFCFKRFYINNNSASHCIKYEFLKTPSPGKLLKFLALRNKIYLKKPTAKKIGHPPEKGFRNMYKIFLLLAAFSSPKMAF